MKQSNQQDELFEATAGDEIEGRAPELRAEIFLFARDRARKRSIQEAIPEAISVRTYEDADTLTEGLAGNVAVVLLSMGLPETELLTASLSTVQETKYARIGLLTGDRDRIREKPIPHDEIFYKSADRKTFQNRLKRLYIRAYYETALQRYYSLCIARQNRLAKLEEEHDDERLRKLTASRDLMESHLTYFNQYLQPGDLDNIRDRREEMKRMINDVREDNDPTMSGLPKQCPDCSLSWGTWHGPDLESGYEKVGANAWRCSGCGTVIGGNDPDNYWIG
ncbi:hypothetical protein Hrd1104_10390 [Halorhabdus sp. CBA1104]|uniref:hypothetical protein n=1 Tax=Halorhabdus sp. CBA1104 TaxID=1380432 RepID=UPI0012B35686|nr:hypothetical protein [Halorhabdus sp. CBA1104]QGN07663.1 hypothetical protein Hrd1104_10390 [Halorhabdus sp. CBA1104]